MAHYRLYTLDGSGCIDEGRDAECDSDEEALTAAARSLNPGVHGEVWRGLYCLGLVQSSQQTIDPDDLPEDLQPLLQPLESRIVIRLTPGQAAGSGGRLPESASPR